MTARPYQLLPPLDEQQRYILRQSIEKSGVLEPVVFDEDGEILDGHHRVEIAEELDIDYPRRVVTDLDEAGKRKYAITVNVARRHLVPAVRSSLVAQLRSQGMSIRGIAEATGVSRGTVANDLAQVSKVGHLPETVTGKDNKTYASTRPTPTPGPVDAAATPPVDPGAASECVGVDMACGRPMPCPDHPTLDLGAAPAPAAESPVSPQEPDLGPGILRVLADVGVALTAQDIAPMLGLVVPAEADDVTAALQRLADRGLVDPAGRALRGTRMEPLWQLAETPEPAAAPSTAPADPGSGEAVTPAREGGVTAEPPTPPPGSPATWTPEQRAANQREIDRKRMVAAGQAAAENLVMSVRAEISTVVSAIDLGEKHLITEQMIADLRRAIDLLESRLEVNA